MNENIKSSDGKFIVGEYVMSDNKKCRVIDFIGPASKQTAVLLDEQGKRRFVSVSTLVKTEQPKFETKLPTKKPRSIRSTQKRTMRP